MAFSGVPKVSGKRRPPTDDEEMFDEAPVKKLKEYFREGYMQYGQTWAEEQFAAGRVRLLLRCSHLFRVLLSSGCCCVVVQPC